MDLVVKTPRVPALGETILGGDFLMVPGGKGANQAVAAAKLGARVHFVARLGDDVFGEQSLANFQAEGIDAEYVTVTPEVASGVALITVDADGNNVIVVAPGANGQLGAQDVERARPAIASADVVVAQLEVPIEAVECAATLAGEAGVPFVLDPAPAQALSKKLLSKVAVLTPNETEAQILTGIDVRDEESAIEAAERFLDLGVTTVIVTMGSKGYLLATEGWTQFVGALSVQAVDTTAAGDAYTGSLAVALAQGKPLADAAQFAARVAALSVTKMGAQSSMPTRQDVEAFFV